MNILILKALNNQEVQEATHVAIKIPTSQA